MPVSRPLDQKGPCGSFAPMNEADIYENLTEIFRDVFDDESITVVPTLTAKDVDGWDSLTHVRLIIAVERAFHLTFSTSEIAGLERVGDLVAIIQSRN
jgi:acyl carrier protein